jgi:pimeloyl-ACP methyl ester carboxylesterase
VNQDDPTPGDDRTRDLVLLHGGLYDASCWSGVVDRLRAMPSPPFRKILTCDAPGAGAKRGREVASLSRQDVVREINAEVRAAGVSNAMLVCHSAANMLLQDLLLEGDLYGQLCSLAGPVLAPGELGSEIFGEGVYGSQPGKIGYALDPKSATREEMQRARFCLDMDEAQSAEMLARLAANKWPMRVGTDPSVAFVSGSIPPATYILTLRNPIFPLEWQQLYASRLGPDVRTVEIDTGHAPFYTHPGLLARTLMDLRLLL